MLPHHAADIDDDAVRILLNELASEIGSILEQEEVHVSYLDQTWTLKAIDELWNAKPSITGLCRLPESTR